MDREVALLAEMDKVKAEASKAPSPCQPVPTRGAVSEEIPPPHPQQISAVLPPVS